MSSISEILALAQSLGLSPEAVERLVDQELRLIKDKAEREDRNADRELKKLELETGEAEKVREEAEKVRKHELELAQIRSTQDVSSTSRNPSSMLPVYEGLKMPTFNEGQDEIDSYLLRFECLTQLHKWEKTDYHIYLGSLLRGRALKVYVSLPIDVVTDFEKLKEALLRAYSVDADSYRRKFRESKCGDKESFAQLVVRMEQYLERWLSLSKVDKDYDKLFDFIIKEQLLSNCNPELRVFLKERDLENAVLMADAADRYKSAHNRGSRIQRSPNTSNADPSDKAGGDSPNNVKVRDDRPCHSCGKTGHWKPECPDNPKNFKVRAA